MARYQVGGSSVAASENASRGAGPSLVSRWRPSRDSTCGIITATGAIAADPELLDKPSSSDGSSGEPQ